MEKNKISSPQLQLSSRPPASTNLPVIKCSLLKVDPLVPLNLSRTTSHAEETSSPHLAMLNDGLKSKISEAVILSHYVLG